MNTLWNGYMNEIMFKDDLPYLIKMKPKKM